MIFFKYTFEFIVWCRCVFTKSKHGQVSGLWWAWTLCAWLCLLNSSQPTSSSELFSVHAQKQLHDSVLISLKADILKGGNKNKAPAATLVVIFHRSCSKSIHSFLKKEGFRNLSSLILRPAVDMITLSRFWDTESYRFWCSAWFVKVLEILDQKNPCSTSFQLEMIMHYKLVIVITVFALLTPWLVSHTILFGSSHDNCGTIYANWVSTVRTGHFPR